MKIRIRSLIPVCMALAVHTASAQVQPVDYVDMFMGNRGESNCVIGPQLPHGSVNPSPQTPGGGNDGYDPLQPIRGFGQLHVSGTGWGRYGQILLSPQVGFSADEQGHDSPKSGESALPYYYAVTLDRYGIRTELAPTHNAAIYRFSFPAAEDANILLDIAHNIPQHIKPEIGGRFLGGAISYDPETGIIGGWGSYRGGFGSGAPYKVYFAAALDRAPRSVAVTDDGDGKLYARIALPPFDAPGTVLLKIAVSLRSESNARKFLAEQIPGHDFEKVKAAARETWNRRLNSIQIDTESETAKKIFYTALYHSFLMARDRTGDNPHTDSDTPHMGHVADKISADDTPQRELRGAEHQLLHRTLRTHRGMSADLHEFAGMGSQTGRRRRGQRHRGRMAQRRRGSGLDAGIPHRPIPCAQHQVTRIPQTGMATRNRIADELQRRARIRLQRLLRFAHGGRHGRP